MRKVPVKGKSMTEKKYTSQPTISASVSVGFNPETGEITFDDDIDVSSGDQADTADLAEEASKDNPDKDLPDNPIWITF
jgi:hypothetical protein